MASGRAAHRVAQDGYAPVAIGRKCSAMGGVYRSGFADPSLNRSQIGDGRRNTAGGDVIQAGDVRSEGLAVTPTHDEVAIASQGMWSIAEQGQQTGRASSPGVFPQLPRRGVWPVSARPGRSPAPRSGEHDGRVGK